MPRCSQNGGGRPVLTERPSDALPPADFASTTADLAAKWDRPIDEERCMAGLLYPKVFDDFMTFCASKTAVSVYLPTPVYFYGFDVGQKCTIPALPAPLAKMECGIDTAEALVDVTLELKRVGPLKKDRMRTVVFAVNGKDQHVEVKNPAAEGEFDGLIEDGMKKPAAPHVVMGNGSPCECPEGTPCKCSPVGQFSDADSEVAGRTHSPQARGTSKKRERPYWSKVSSGTP